MWSWSHDMLDLTSIVAFPVQYPHVPSMQSKLLFVLFCRFCSTANYPHQPMFILWYLLQLFLTPWLLTCCTLNFVSKHEPERVLVQSQHSTGSCIVYHHFHGMALLPQTHQQHSEEASLSSETFYLLTRTFFTLTSPAWPRSTAQFWSSDSGAS